VCVFNRDMCLSSQRECVFNRDMCLSLQRECIGICCLSSQRECVLKKELSRVCEPNRFYRFSCRIWFPQNWIVRRHLYGDEEVIPTVISDVPVGAAGHSHVPEPDEVLKIIPIGVQDLIEIYVTLINTEVT